MAESVRTRGAGRNDPELGIHRRSGAGVLKDRYEPPELHVSRLEVDGPSLRDGEFEVGRLPLADIEFADKDECALDRRKGLLAVEMLINDGRKRHEDRKPGP